MNITYVLFDVLFPYIQAMFRLISSLSRLSVSASNAVGFVHCTSCRSISTSSSLNIYMSPYVLGQPLRKKNRIDPMIEKARTDRKKRKLEKRIRQLERQARLFKPVEELMPNFDLKEEAELRARPSAELTIEEQDRRILLLKAWSKEQRLRSLSDALQLRLASEAQEEALQELKHVSPTLYQAAIEPFDELFPYTGKGPTITPPIANFDTPDGNYVDKSKKWIITATGELI